MNTAPIPLEAFHRHVLVTHLKGDSDCVLKQLQERWPRSGEPFGALLAQMVLSCYPKHPEYLEEHWYAEEIALDKCYFAHTDFRLFPVPKDTRFVDFLRDRVQEIEQDSFPHSREIRAEWSGRMREPLVREREPEKFYILDGQLRVIWHWFHQRPNVRVFAYKGNRGI